jgi:hypothetical protein
MGRTERGAFVASSIALLIALSAVSGVAAHAPSDGATEPGSTLVSASPAVFAERVTAAHRDGRFGSLQNTLELFGLALICAIGVALFSATSDRPGPSDGPRARPR